MLPMLGQGEGCNLLICKSRGEAAKKWGGGSHYLGGWLRFEEGRHQASTVRKEKRMHLEGNEKKRESGAKGPKGGAGASVGKNRRGGRRGFARCFSAAN